MKNKGFALFVLILIILGVFAAGGGIYYYQKQTRSQESSNQQLRETDNQQVDETAKQHIRDVSRISDIQEIRLALEIYFNKNKIYPNTLDVLIETRDLNRLRLPTNPTPGGINYEYRPINNGVSYALKYYLETKNGQLNAGEQIASPANYASNIDQSFNLNSGSQTQVNNENNKTGDIGENEARDKKRVNDIKQIQLTLIMYHDQYKKYPNNLSDLINGHFIGAIPTNPIPGGIDYEYQVLSDGSNYSLVFSLEVGYSSNTEFFSAGKHTANQEGIK